MKLVIKIFIKKVLFVISFIDGIVGVISVWKKFGVRKFWVRISFSLVI